MVCSPCLQDMGALEVEEGAFVLALSSVLVYLWTSPRASIRLGSPPASHAPTTLEVVVEQAWDAASAEAADRVLPVFRTQVAEVQAAVQGPLVSTGELSAS